MTSPSDLCVPPCNEYPNLRDRMEHIKQVTLRTEAAPLRRRRVAVDVGRVFDFFDRDYPEYPRNGQ